MNQEIKFYLKMIIFNTILYLILFFVLRAGLNGMSCNSLMYICIIAWCLFPIILIIKSIRK